MQMIQCVRISSSQRVWFEKLCRFGPSYGYYPEPKKAVIVVDEKDEESANACFHNSGIKVVSGYRFHGGFISSKELIKQFIADKLDAWLVCVDNLAWAAEKQPQAAYAAMAKSLQFEWSFVQRIIPNSESSFAFLQDKINTTFWPAVCSTDISQQELRLFTLPARMGGMGVNDPVETARTAFITSRACTDVIVTAIKGKGDFSVYDHLQQMTQAKKEMTPEIKGFQEDKLTSVLASLSEGKKRAIKRAVKGKTSTWLTVIPVSHYHFDLSPSEFRDALAIRYHQIQSKLPADCDGCGGEFTLQHALDCIKGGLIIQRHNEVRDALGDFASIAFRDVIREPIVRDADPVRGLSALVTDLGVRGLWAAQTEALFDIRVLTLTPSHIVATLLILFCYQLKMRRKRNTWMLLRLDMLLSPLLSPQSLLVKLTLP